MNKAKAIYLALGFKARRLAFGGFASQVRRCVGVRCVIWSTYAMLFAQRVAILSKIVIPFISHASSSLHVSYPPISCKQVIQFARRAAEFLLRKFCEMEKGSQRQKKWLETFELMKNLVGWLRWYYCAHSKDSIQMTSYHMINALAWNNCFSSKRIFKILKLAQSYIFFVTWEAHVKVFLTESAPRWIIPQYLPFSCEKNVRNLESVGEVNLFIKTLFCLGGALDAWFRPLPWLGTLFEHNMTWATY